MLQYLAAVYPRLGLIAALVLLASCASSKGHGPVDISTFPPQCASTSGMDRVRCVVDTHKAIIFRVYNRHRSMSRSFSGMVTFRLYIVKAGKVRTVDVVQNTTGNIGFAEEVADNLRAMNFGELKQDRLIRYPMYFQPVKN